MITTRPIVISNQRYSIKETSFFLGIGKSTLARLTKKGKLTRYVHVTGQKFYWGRDILAFYDNVKPDAAQAQRDEVDGSNPDVIYFDPFTDSK